jgi:hypothetical protein
MYYIWYERLDEDYVHFFYYMIIQNQRGCKEIKKSICDYGNAITGLFIKWITIFS